MFWLAAIPGALAVLVVAFGVRDIPRDAQAAGQARRSTSRSPLGARFWRVLAVIFVFTLGNSTDAFLLLRAKSARRAGRARADPLGGAASREDRRRTRRAARSPTGSAGGRRSSPGGLLYAAVYFGFARAHAAWQAWALFGVYGLFFGLTEGAERALVADLVAAGAARHGVRLVQPRDRARRAAGVADVRLRLGSLSGRRRRS